MVLVAHALCLCDHRNVNLSGLGVMARDAQHRAVLQAIVSTKRGRDDVIEMLLMIDGKAAPLAGRQYPFAQPFGALQGIPHGGLAEFQSHDTNSNSRNLTPRSAPKA